jgi:hypothetical protein
MKDGLSKLNLLLEIERDIPEDLAAELTQGARTCRIKPSSILFSFPF